MWIYSTISPKLVDMIVDDSASGVSKRLTDIFHDNKDARVIQLDNEIRNMVIGNLSVTDFFQDLKSKADRLANLGSKVNDSSLVTYAINGVRGKFPEVARIIRHREKLPTFDEMRSMMLLEENDVLNQHMAANVSHHTSSSPTVLLATPASTDKTNTMSSSGLDACRNFQRGSCTYGAKCKFVHGLNDSRPRPSSSSKSQVPSHARSPQNTSTCGVSSSHEKTSTQVLSSGSFTMPNMSPVPCPVYMAQPNIGLLYFQSGLGTHAQPIPPAKTQQAHLMTTGPVQPTPLPVPQARYRFHRPNISLHIRLHRPNREMQRLSNFVAF
ncbi:hypothetical protein CTI12_AA123280 [Artemisia annua]|uniref:C3H1-type domain-containing protein n=1 Tax=Artemisia annua TaxID=35608 RepID=A0A2U1NIQ6_ARTAN|nr:hypothetical protein CTI12_AA123280 [Artemisia annua]